MTRAEVLAGRVNAAIGPLAMARDLLFDLVPNAADPHSAARATDLAQQLIDQTVEILTRPDDHASNVIALSRGDGQ